ncbi:hypothetical protein WJX72_006407 [[Myrmecia] bisecta]|uniref:Pan3 C-terminal knob domain-containing protein n=1 Tax=[Myrmecia] bisecta TaxID=41462 RepID=A0AAW1QFC5_9CHLO
MTDVKAQRPSGQDPVQAPTAGPRVTAAPFVPGKLLAQAQGPAPTGQQGQQQASRARVVTASLINAKPFVPASRGGANNVTNSSSSGSLPTLASQGSGLNRSLSQTAINAAPFVPGSGQAASGQGQAGRGAAAMSSAAQPFVPKRPTATISPRSLAKGRGPGGPSRSDHRLPEGDDLLGMTAHTPGELASMAAPAALRAPAPGAADKPFAPTSGPLSPNRAQREFGYPQQSFRSPAKGRGHPAYQPASPARGPTAYGRGASSVGGRGMQGGGMQASGPGLAPGRGRGRAMSFGGPAGPGSHAHAGPGAGSFQAAPGKLQMAAHFMAERLRQELQQRSYLTQAQVNPESEGDLGMPEMIQQYHSLYPLEEAGADELPSQAYGVGTVVLKGISSVDGAAYALRRIDGRQVPPSGELLSAAQETVEVWSSLTHHPHLLVPKAVFVSSEMDGTPAIYFVHDYQPAAVSLEQAHIQPTMTSAGLVRNTPSEEHLWTYLVQLTAALRAVHCAGLACRPGSLLASKVLLISAGRIKIGSLGVLDLINCEGRQREDIGQLQRDDLAAVGRLLLVLACSGTQSASLDFCSMHFSADLTRVIGALLAANEGGGLQNWRQLCGVLGERMLGELDALHLYSDAVVSQLSKEAENGRLLRLLIRLSTINERPEADMDPQWSETGDRYLLKLFRDFVFHQIAEDGAPQIDYGHIIEALNKLDAGVPEKVLLLSRDDQSLLQISYADVKRCIDSVYDELKQRGATARARSRVDRQRHQHAD